MTEQEQLDECRVELDEFRVELADLRRMVVEICEMLDEHLEQCPRQEESLRRAISVIAAAATAATSI